MTDQFLQDALREYIRDLERESQSGLTENLAAYAKDQVKALRKLLAAHPAEPALVCSCDGPGPEGQHRTWCRLFDPGNDDPWEEQEPAPVGVEITDEAVEAAASRAHGWVHDLTTSRCPGSDECGFWSKSLTVSRMALEAARPALDAALRRAEL